MNSSPKSSLTNATTNRSRRLLARAIRSCAPFPRVCEALEGRCLLNAAVVSINRTTPPAANTNAASVSYTVTFSQPVTGVDASDFKLGLLGGVAATTPVVVKPVNQSVYTVTVNQIHGSGSIGLNFVDNGTVRDLAGKRLQSNADTAGSFAPQKTITVGRLPSWLTSTDVNRDGKPDIIVANLADATVSVLLGRGDGTFLTRRTFAVGSFVSFVISADLNGDGNPDLITANHTSGGDPGTVNVLLGKGDGTFKTYKSFAVGLVPTSVTAADLNNDGKTDLATANLNDATLSVLLGNGDGTFKTQVSYAPRPMPAFVTSADVSGDGKIDLLTSTGNDGTVGLFLGNGDGTFQPQKVLTAGANPGFLITTDVNGDGKPDLAATNGQSGTVSVLLGNGDGTFLTPKTAQVGSYPNSLTSADLNGDGKPDLVTSNWVSNDISVLLGNGDGTFLGPKTYAVGANPTGVTSADLNGDGRPDLIVSNGGNGFGQTISVLLGAGNDNFTGPLYSIGPNTLTVDTPSDAANPGAGLMTLRHAVAIANANSAPTTINFDPVVFAGTKTITLNGQDLELSNKSAAVTIVGPGANRLTIDANARSRIFQIDAGVTATISGLTLTNGNVYSNPTTNWDASGGGAIRNDGTLNLSNTFLNANHGGQAGGGGLFNKGTANLLNCTISNNHVDTPQFVIGGDGGGIAQDGPILNLTNVTLAGNSVNDGSYGGGINFGERNVTTNLVNCTIVNNVASASFYGGGGVAMAFNAAGTVMIANSIIAGNHLFRDAQLPGVDVKYSTSAPWSGVLISKGHNLIGKADGSSGWTATDRTGTLANPLDPKLSPLSDNGGPMPTIVPLAGSPAIDAGGNALLPAGLTTDQRGQPRISGFIVDIGATEFQQAPAVTGFVLVNADTNKDIMPIAEGMTLDLAKLPRRLNIRALASSKAKSVQLIFDGQPRMELQAPWAVFGDWDNDYVFGNLTKGSHTLTAQAFAGQGAASGAVGDPATVHFKVINQAPAPMGTVIALVLYNTATNKDIRVLKNNDVLDLTGLPATLGVRARTAGTVNSVQYVVDAKVGVPATNALALGGHTLTAISYSGANNTGTPGASLEVHFNVITHSFTETFSSSKLNPNLEDPDHAYTINNGLIHLKSTTGTEDRHYIRTIAGDYYDHFTYELTYENPVIDFIGIGAGVPSTEPGDYREPGGGSLYLRLHAPGLVGGMVGLAFDHWYTQFAVLGNVTSTGKHRVRITRDGDKITFAVDVQATGAFVPEMSYTLDLNTRPDIKAALSRSSHLFFGNGDTFSTFDDMKVTVG